MAVQSGLQPIHNNVIDTIKLLREAGIKTAALSNTWVWTMYYLILI